MRLLSVELANFRKFRTPTLITGFAEGLNIVVEPNETGKSTLLEALRAAFFLRHSAKNELVRSFCPFGDDVAPRIAVEFEIDGANWRVEKQFLKAAYVTLTGPEGRIESDAAEERLQTLLDFERGNNRGNDPETRGALGLLWVEQAGGLQVGAPNRLVRDNIRSVLEGEVGAILGGRRFERVQARIEEAYATYRTSKSGKSTGRLAEAEEAAHAARARREAAATVLHDYEQALTQLEQARNSKRLVERDLSDPEIAERLKQLNEDLKIADTAQLRLSNASARYAETETTVKIAEQQLQRFDAALAAVTVSAEAMATAEGALEAQRVQSGGTLETLNLKREAMIQVREGRTAAEAAVEAARSQLAARDRSAALQRVQTQFAEVRRLEQRIAEKEALSAQAIGKQDLEALAELDRKAVEARVLFEAGAVGIDIDLCGDAAVKIDGEKKDAGRYDVVRPIEILFDNVARLVVTPPGAGGLSAEAGWKAADEALTAKLKALGVDSFAAATGRTDKAAAATEELVSLKSQMEGLCPGEPALALAPGVTALKALLAEPPTEIADAAQDDVDDESAKATLFAAREAESVATGQLEAAQAAAHSDEKKLIQLQTERAGAERAHQTSRQNLEALEAETNREVLALRTVSEREELGRRTEALEQAKAAAASFDAERIRKAIANIEREQIRGREELLEQVSRIASLETIVASEGPKGLASLANEAEEMETAAVAHLTRLAGEADTLELLRATLKEVGDEASRTFLGPVTRRAARYIERILPGSDPEFNEEMSLVGLVRGGTEEACGDLSRGTQEQLAILTRLAFADLLLDKGAPVSLILDDPLVYSDDGRFEVMTDILMEAASRMQVILLTCRAKAFRHVAAHRIAIGEHGNA
jgi:hypothetical protein